MRARGFSVEKDFYDRTSLPYDVKFWKIELKSDSKKIFVIIIFLFILRIYENTVYKIQSTQIKFCEFLDDFPARHFLYKHFHSKGK